MKITTLLAALGVAASVAVGSHDAAAQAPAVKPPLRGLISMGAYKFAGENAEPDNSMDTIRKKPGLLQGVVILATWRDLEKSPGNLTPDEIEKGLTEVRKYNKEHPDAPLAVKLRVWGGYFAPKWAMDESGGEIALVHTNNQGKEMPRKLGHVWESSYRKRWAHLQEMLAAKYDGEPLIREVAVTSCMMTTAEPFSIDSSPKALGPIRKAGLTDTNYKACLDGIVDDYKPWKTTRFETPLNPFKLTDNATDKVAPTKDTQFTFDWMKRCETREPKRCAFDNHDLDSDISNELMKVYERMGTSKAEVEFQIGPTMPKSPKDIFRIALEKGATSVEVWQDYGGFTQMSDADLKLYGKFLVSNRPDLR